jgi:hypothetical protein
MPTEAGSFLFCALKYDDVVAMASGFHRITAQGRMPAAGSRPTAVGARPPRLLPSCLEWVPRVLAEARLRRGITPAGDMLEAPRVPRWRCVMGDAWWEQDEEAPLA